MAPTDEQVNGMRKTRRRKRTGMLYVLPALLFVLAFTVYPFIRMFWISLNNWSLITPPKYVGLDNFSKAFDDEQFWASLRFTLKYTLMITPILMIGGYLVALLTASNTRLRRVTRTILFVPVVIGLGASSLLWYWLFSARYGLVNKALLDLGIIDKPVLWLGTDANLGNWAVITSVVWKVLGFGMILFVAAIQAIPTEVNEAATVDGASPWQRTTRVTLPLTMRTVLLVTLVERDRLAARVRPVLPDDRRPAAESDGDVGLLRLPQLVPVLEARIRRGAVVDPGLHRADLHGDPADPDEAEPGMSTRAESRRRRATRSTRVDSVRVGRVRRRICVAICTIMVLPIVASVLASVKPTAEAAKTPPTYVPHGLSFDAYRRLWEYQSGLPTYVANSLVTALLTVVLTLVPDDPGRIRLGSVSDSVQGAAVRAVAARPDHSVSGAPDPDLLDVRRLRAHQLADRSGHHPHGHPVAVQPLHHAQQLRGGAARTGGSGDDRRRQLGADPAPGVPSRRGAAIITVALFAFITSWNEYLGALVMMNKDSKFTLPLILASSRTETSLGGTDWGMLQAGITISIIPCVGFYLLLQKYFVAGFLTGAVK